MTTMRLVPMLPPRGRDRRRAGHRRYGTLAVSLGLHALALLLLLLLARPREESGTSAGSPSFELMFEPPAAPETGNGAPAPATPPPPPAPDTVPGPPTPTPDTLPDLVTPPSPESPPAPELPPQPAAPAEQPPPVPAPPVPAPPEPAPRPAPEPAPVPLPEAPTAPPPPLPTGPAEAVPQAQPAPFDPNIRLEQPPPPPPILPPVPDLVLPPLPTPSAPTQAPAVPRPAPPRPAAPPPRQAPPPTIGTFANPLDLNFSPAAPRFAAPRLGSRPGSIASRSLDLSPGPARAPNRQEAFFDARAARIGADWKDGLESYWLRHRYYPRQAAEAGEDGQVEVELTVNRYGKVETVTVQGKSGSPWLDMAAVSVWRGAQLAPLPPEVGDHITFSITIHYILVR